MKVGVVTLGCDKNTVDSERYLARLGAYGAVQADSLDEAELIVVNTCGFIDAAKAESIDAIVDAARYKTGGACRALVAIGCMIERHRSELESELPEVDLFLGTSDADRLVPELEARGVLGGEMLAHPGVRQYMGDLPHVRYLKVSEGCDHGCAFCAIPLMRGRHRSFPHDEVVREAQLLELAGAREINLVAQDLAHYGRDLRDGTNLVLLLEALARETSIPWIRMLYLYSAGITQPLLDVIASEPRIVRYLDTPIQHASDAVLARMRRPERDRTIRERVARFRDAIPDVAIRTTCIVGFPGETDADFAHLLNFLEDVRFDRVGAFTYSAQEGTRAAELPDDVPDALKRERLERLTELQRGISAEKNEDRVGKRVVALIDLPDAAAGISRARLQWQADDIDGVTWVDSVQRAGSFVEVAITEVRDDFDYVATAIRELPDAGGVVRAAPARQSLPLASAGSHSFGR
ncbi:MAG TPA: 30S ribosomal protein S12 methylthiotransferase RimO [Candidatus Limnocylindria bacterium]|nr:30S ribosomal protein S12 methylthiotransferase RimO [Candidatus Limnocylindria bacterium]